MSNAVLVDPIYHNNPFRKAHLEQVRPHAKNGLWCILHVNEVLQTIEQRSPRFGFINAEKADQSSGAYLNWLIMWLGHLRPLSLVQSLMAAVVFDHPRSCATSEAGV